MGCQQVILQVKGCPLALGRCIVPTMWASNWNLILNLTPHFLFFFFFCGEHFPNFVLDTVHSSEGFCWLVHPLTLSEQKAEQQPPHGPGGTVPSSLRLSHPRTGGGRARSGSSLLCASSSPTREKCGILPGNFSCGNVVVAGWQEKLVYILMRYRNLTGSESVRVLLCRGDSSFFSFCILLSQSQPGRCSVWIPFFLIGFLSLLFFTSPGVSESPIYWIPSQWV